LLGIGLALLVGVYEVTASLVALPLLPSELALPLIAVGAIVAYSSRVVADARGGVTFETPYRVDFSVDLFPPGEEHPRKGRGYLYRIPLQFRRREDTIFTEAYVTPELATRQFVNLPIHFSKREPPGDLWQNSFKEVTLRHGQRAYLDVVSLTEQADGTFKCELLYISPIPNSSGVSYYRLGVALESEQYELSVKVFFSDRANDEKTYRLNVDIPSESVRVTPRWM
jgi:hypothetical protein